MCLTMAPSFSPRTAASGIEGGGCKCLTMAPSFPPRNAVEGCLCLEVAPSLAPCSAGTADTKFSL